METFPSIPLFELETHQLFDGSLLRGTSMAQLEATLRIPPTGSGKPVPFPDTHFAVPPLLAFASAI